MSEEDTIRVNIDDSDIDAAIAKIQTMMALSAEATGDGAGGRPGAKGLPGINRELRLILSQVPGAREAIQVYFRLSRMVRGFGAGGINLYLTILATIVLAFKMFLQHEEDVKRERARYESYIRRERKITHDEFTALEAKWSEAARSRPG